MDTGAPPRIGSSPRLRRDHSEYPSGRRARQHNGPGRNPLPERDRTGKGDAEPNQPAPSGFRNEVHERCTEQPEDGSTRSE